MASDVKSFHEDALEVENVGLRDLLTHAGVDAAWGSGVMGRDRVKSALAI
jgi:hypothetical protein